MILLQEMNAVAELDEPAVLELAGEILGERRRDERAGLGREQELGIGRKGERGVRRLIVASTSAGSPAIGISLGKRQVGRRD